MRMKTSLNSYPCMYEEKTESDFTMTFENDIVFYGTNCTCATCDIDIFVDGICIASKKGLYNAYQVLKAAIYCLNHGLYDPETNNIFDAAITLWKETQR